ncbi:MAG: SET domain-containing protein-lysine N-methyltransferase [Gemmatimonadota bacterium]|nr:SET domain-containing protein-lysine N-methyltransferase [Gemmatimonadota bacterium]
MAKTSVTQPFVVKESAIAGKGAFATRRIRAGTRIVEYIGEHITDEESDRRYDDDAMEHAHTFLFTVDDDDIIDAAVRGNDARFINHSCDPNCESVTAGSQVFVYAIKNIQPGAELTYDYKLHRSGVWRARYAAQYKCLCGAKRCRGVILYHPRRPKKKKGKKGVGGSGLGRVKRRY